MDIYVCIYVATINYWFLEDLWLQRSKMLNTVIPMCATFQLFWFVIAKTKINLYIKNNFKFVVHWQRKVTNQVWLIN